MHIMVVTLTLSNSFKLKHPFLQLNKVCVYHNDTFSPNAKQGVSHIDKCWIHIGPEYEPPLNANS